VQFDELKQGLIGEWRGTKRLYFSPPPAPAITSPTKLVVRQIAGESFLQFDYDWAYEGEKQSGTLLFGSDEEDVATAAWVDSFHMSSKILSCTGTAERASATVLGSYEAPPGPDWGWRIIIRAVSSSEHQIVMHNISPEGQEDLAVQIDYTRSA